MPISVFRPTLSFFARGALAACLFVASSALGGDLAESLRLVPADADLVVIADGASIWRDNRAGKPLAMLAEAVSGSNDLGRAWRALSQQLGLDESAAFDLLLGDRVVFAQRGRPGGPAMWALTAEVKPEAERLLREKLRPAPRRVEQGTAVLALEDGRFLLAARTVGNRSMLLLGPAAADQMFEELLPSLGKPAKGRLLETPAGERARTLGRDVQAAAILRLRDNGVDQGWAGVGIAPLDEGVRFSVFVDAPALEADLARITTSSSDAFDALTQNVFFAELSWPQPSAAKLFGLEELGASMPQLFESFAGSDLLDGRAMLLAAPLEGGIATFAIARETSNTRALAPLADRLMSTLISGFWSGVEGAAFDVSTVDFAGEFPDTLREVDLSKPVNRALPGVFPEGPVAAWIFAPSITGAPPADKDAPQPGWWVAGTDGPLVRQAAQSLTAPANDGARREPWVSLGVIRPAALIRAVEARGMILPGDIGKVAAAARGVEVAQWRLFRKDAHTIEGGGVLKFIVEPAAVIDAKRR